MSVLSVDKMWSKTGGTFASSKYYTFANQIGLTEGYQIVADVGDSIATIEAASGLPRYGDAHPTVPLAYVESINIEPMGPIFWLATVSYRGEVEANQIEVSWTDTSATEPIDRDWNGAAIVTANGEPVDGLTVEVPDQVVTIRRTFLSIDLSLIAQYRRAVNSDTFLGWPPGTARLIGFEADNKFSYGGTRELWKVTARIQFRQPYANTTPAQAWYQRWRHEGLWVKAGTPPVIQRARDQQGQESPKPVLLKLDGTQETNPNNAVFIHTQVYDSLPYSGLGLL